MDDEFEAVAAWTAEAVRDLGHDHALPAACQGSGGPASLDWLTDRLGLAEGVRLLDSGAGTGGPAEYAARTSGARPVLLEPSAAACRTARRLFGHPVVVADGVALPVADGSVEAAWSVAVLCTVPDKVSHLRELARVLSGQGRLGLLVYERTVQTLPDAPEGNHFTSAEETDALVRQAGLVVGETALLADVPEPPADWQAAADRVDTWIADRHGAEPAWRRAQEQRERLVALIESGLVAGRLIMTRLAADPDQPAGSLASTAQPADVVGPAVS